MNDAMLPHAAIVTHGPWSRVHKGKTAPLAQAGLHIRTQRTNRRRDEFHKALIADRHLQLTLQMAEQLGHRIGLEITKPHLMEGDQNRDNLAHR
jgi:hypothetical protein